MAAQQSTQSFPTTDIPPKSPAREEYVPEFVAQTTDNPTPTVLPAPPPAPPTATSSQSLPQRSLSRRSEYGPRKGYPYRNGYATDYEGPMSARSLRSARSMRSTRRLRLDDDYDDEDTFYEKERDFWRDRDEFYNPERYARRSMHQRPPRAWRNRPYLDETETVVSPMQRDFAEETQSQRRYRLQDEEMGTYGMKSLDWNSLSTQEKAEVMRLPLTQWMNSELKNHFVASLGELVGTTLFLFFAFAGTEVANIQSKAPNDTTTGESTGFDVSVLLFIALVFGFSLMVNVWIFFRISGGLFNPAVTFAMVLVKAIKPVRAICLFLAQMIGAIIASVIVRYLFPENFNVRTTLSGGTTLVQGVFIEAILTSELVFTIFMLAKEKHRATFIAPVGIGLALFIAELVGVQFTGGSLNPARSFGPCAVTRTFDQEHWIYWIGPFVGALIAVLFYRFIKTLEYEMANPGADGDPTNDPTQNPDKRAEIVNMRKASSH